MAAPVSPQLVGNAFVQQYYHVLHHSPGLLHRFYQDISKLGRPEEDGSMSVTTTMDAINAKILSLNYGDFKAEIKYVDAQESLNSGVSVLVTGYLTGMDNIQQQFTQYFFLAPQDKGYFVLNDMFRYTNTANHHEEDHAPTEDVVAPATPEEVPEVVPVAENDISEQPAVLTEEYEAEQVVPAENGEVPTVEEDPIPEVFDEVQDSSQLAVESHTKIEEVPKKSYASIVMDMKQNGLPFSSPAPAPRKPQPKKQEQHLNNAVPTTVAAEPVPSNVDAVENILHKEEVEGYSVYIKHLPMNATHALLEEEFKKFGPIKPNGIQIRNNRGFYFGFVEFEVPDAVQKAIEASPIMINGKNTVVEEKRSTNSKGVNRGRFVGGRGPGFRNDVTRGRGSFGGGRGYNRGGDFGGSRNDYGYRDSGRGGPSSNRGGDGYQRDNNGGHMNRGVNVSGIIFKPSSNRGGDGYQRDNNGGHMNPGLDVSGIVFKPSSNSGGDGYQSDNYGGHMSSGLDVSGIVFKPSSSRGGNGYQRDNNGGHMNPGLDVSGIVIKPSSNRGGDGYQSDNDGGHMNPGLG